MVHTCSRNELEEVDGKVELSNRRAPVLVA